MKLDQVTALDWEKNDGLLPAIVQDARSGQVLMLASDTKVSCDI